MKYIQKDFAPFYCKSGSVNSSCAEALLKVNANCADAILKEATAARGPHSKQEAELTPLVDRRERTFYATEVQRAGLLWCTSESVHWEEDEPKGRDGPASV